MNKYGTTSEIRIALCYRNSIMSRLIRFFTSSTYSHASILLDNENRTYVIEAQKKGIHIMTYENWIDKYNYSYITFTPTTILRPESRKQIHESIWMYVGVRNYDFASLLIHQPLYIITGKWIGRRDKRAQKRLTCSEFIALVLDIPKNWKKTPEDLYQYLVESSKWDLGYESRISS